MKKALVVGINKYPSAPLLGCVKDATDIAGMLERNDDHSLNFNVLLQTDVPRKSELMKLIQDLFSGQNDTELLYFSGHGLLNRLGGFLVTPDERRYDEGIAMNDIIALANQSASAHKIIILDCCHSGAIAAPALSPFALGHINEGVTILTASKQDEIAMEVRGKGVFTNLLLEALKGGAADLNGNITPAGVYAYIDQALGPWEQRPVFKTNVSRFTALRKAEPQLPVTTLRKITEYFPQPGMPHLLDPSYEHTNNPDRMHLYATPYAAENKVAVFKILQEMQAAGLVEPVDEAHMYWAAMNGRSCRLTPLGEHYWRLVNANKI